MTISDTERAEELLAGLRASIDNLDAILVHTLAERFNRETGLDLSHHDLWRIVAKLAK